MLSFSMKGKSLRRLCWAAFLWLTYTSSRLFTVTAVSWKAKALDGFTAQLFYDLRTRALVYVHCNSCSMKGKSLRRLYSAVFQWLTYTSSRLFSYHRCSMNGKNLWCVAFPWLMYTSSRLFSYHSCSMNGKNLWCVAFPWLMYTSSRMFFLHRCFIDSHAVLRCKMFHDWHNPGKLYFPASRQAAYSLGGPVRP